MEVRQVYIRVAQGSGPCSCVRVCTSQVITTREASAVTVPLGIESENKARKTFLYLLRKETVKNLSNKILAVNIIALLPNSK